MQTQTVISTGAQQNGETFKRTPFANTNVISTGAQQNGETS
ncbi:hypothetical protein [Pedobacter boryungensis]|nr:hypothetical protein [Pedobacter boryungensis]